MNLVFSISYGAAAIAMALVVAVAGCGEAAYDLDGGDELVVGKAFVAERGCAKCHQDGPGAAGTVTDVLAGQASVVAGTMAYGPNLTPDVATGLGAWADIEIVRAMRFGVDNHQMPLCPSMPHHDGSDGGQPFMSDLEARAIVAWLRSLPRVSRAVPASLCPPLKSPPDPDMADVADAGAP